MYVCILSIQISSSNQCLWVDTRKFSPAYGDRDSRIRRPFLTWIRRTLEDFQLPIKEFYGATSDRDSDVVALLTEDLSLHWERCSAQMVHAPTRNSFGMNDTAACRNPDMRDLISKLTRAMYPV